MKKYQYGYLLCSLLFSLCIFAIIQNAEPSDETAAVCPNGKYVALTFDDGPRADTTIPLLDGLRQRGARVTFFVLGSLAEWNEDILLRMAEDGHQIGQHTYSHVALENQRDWMLRQELTRTEQILQRVLGEGDYWLRPPYGLISERQYALCETPLITWSVDPEDWKSRDCEKIKKAVLTSVQSGDVILMHDIYESSVEAALEIVDALQRQGYNFVTVRELMELYGVTPAAGELYRSPLKPGRGY
ncbi:MAG: polysaccharide deacetylase family protein [Oscillospiraceae bacterium]|nr:polysaccharide deacetylase family protein [Oscillospiraceae bacterium]